MKLQVPATFKYIDSYHGCEQSEPKIGEIYFAGFGLETHAYEYLGEDCGRYIETGTYSELIGKYGNANK